MGKSREAIAAAVLLLSRARGGVRFFVPPALVLNWRAEIDKFSAEVQRRRGPRSVKSAARRLAKSAEEFVVSTSRLKRFARSKDAKRVRLVVLDEAHKARNKKGRLYKWLLTLTRRGRKHLGLLFLTATPFQCNHEQELISLLSLLDRGWDPNSELPGRDGFPSIVNGLSYGLRQLKKRLKQLRDAGEEPAVALEQLLRELDRNLDWEYDASARTFGVATGHDGFDEYLRSLVVRSRKPRIRSREVPVNIDGDDSALYLFGREYLRVRARVHDQTGAAVFAVFTEVHALPLDEEIVRHHGRIGWAAQSPI